MKHMILLSLLICLAGFLCAESADDPVTAYLNDPGPATFKLAVDAATEAMQANESPLRNTLNLAYISDHEAQRLIDELLASADSLAAGERFFLANILLGRDDFTRAITLYDGLNQDYPNWSCPWRHKGEASFRLGDHEAAVRALEQAIATNTNHYDAYIWMAFALNEMGQFAEALENLELAKKLPLDAQVCEDEELSQESIQQLYQELRQKVQ